MKMNTVSYGEIRVSDERTSGDIRRIEYGCAQCLYEAGKIATRDILSAVIENELTDAERDAVRLYWFGGMKISKIAQKAEISSGCVRRLLKNAEKKIYGSLKYVVLHDYMLGGERELPKDFHFKIINCINGKELIA